MSSDQYNLGNPNPPTSSAYYGVGKYGDTGHQHPDHRNRRLNPLSPAAVVAGLAALFLGVSFAVPWGLVAIVLGSVAIAQVRGSEGRLSGVGVAAAGIALGLVQVVVWIS